MKRVDSKPLQQVHKRTAIVTVMVLVVLLLLSSMIAAFVRRAVSDRRQMRAQFYQQQTQQLVEAGIQLALQKSKDASYAGEEWEIPAGLIHQTNSGFVGISLKGEAATVVARYPVNSDNPHQITRTVRLQR